MQHNIDSDYDEFDIDQLQKTMNSYDWRHIDKQLTSVPSNKYYEVQIPDKQSTYKVIIKFRYILEHQQTHYQPCTLALCSYLLKSSTNNYYALMLRKKIVSKQMSLCQQEDFIMKKRLLQRQLKFMNNLLEDNPKEYHVWTYKKDLISSILKDQRKTQQSSRTQFTQQIYLNENKFIFSLLIEDCRNYHAWDYRFWLVTFLNKIEDELKWIDQLITNNCGLDPLIQQIEKSGQLTVKDMKINWMEVNSLWSHKFNLIKYIRQHQNERSNKIFKRHQNEQQLNIHEQNNQSSNINTLIQKQLTQSITLLQYNRKNEPLWNYLSGLIKMIQHSKQLNNLYNQHIKQQLKLLFDQTQIKILQIKHMNRFQLSFLKRHVDLFGLKKKQCQVLNEKILLRLKQIDSTREKYYDYLIQTKNGNKL